MASQRLYSMKDIKIGEFGPVMIAVSEPHMFRILQEAMRGQSGTATTFPKDFELWLLGEFDTAVGVVVPQLKFVCGLDVILNPEG